MSLLGGVFAGVGSALGGLFGFGSQSKTNKANQKLAAQQNEYNLALQQNEFAQNAAQSELAYQRELEIMNLQNEYNSPQQQLERYKAAGLNPNLIYGSGSASAGNTATSSPSYTPAKYTAPRAERATNVAPQLQFDPYQAISIRNQLALQKANISQVGAQTDAVMQSTKNSAIDELIKAAQLQGANLTNRQREELYDVTIEHAREQLRKTTYEVANLHHLALNIQKRSNLSEAQLYKVHQEIINLRTTNDLNRWRIELSKIGLSDKDPLWFRLGSRMLLANDEEVREFFNVLTK